MATAPGPTLRGEGLDDHLKDHLPQARPSVGQGTPEGMVRTSSATTTSAMAPLAATRNSRPSLMRRKLGTSRP